MDDKSKLDRIREAIQRRDRFLEGHPELKAFQEEIDRRLSNAGGIENRFAVLGFMIHEQILRFDQGLCQLKQRIEATGVNRLGSDRRVHNNRRLSIDRRVSRDPFYGGNERRNGKDRRTGLVWRESQEVNCSFL